MHGATTFNASGARSPPAAVDPADSEANLHPNRFTMNTITSKFARVCALAVLISALVTGVASAIAGNHVPWGGTAAGSVVAVTPTPAGVLLTIHASGHANQLGHFTRVEELLLDPGTGAFTGAIVFVAANQDELHVTMVGGFVSPTTAIGSYTVVGGTGRFVQASGSAAFEAVSPDGIHLNVNFDGTISSVGG